MKRKIKKFLNIYVVVGFIGVFSILYMLSFVFVINDVASGSSADMKEEYLKEHAE